MRKRMYAKLVEDQTLPICMSRGTAPEKEDVYQEVRQYFLSRDCAGSKWCPVLKVWEQPKDQHSKVM